MPGRLMNLTTMRIERVTEKEAGAVTTQLKQVQNTVDDLHASLDQLIQAIAPVLSPSVVAQGEPKDTSLTVITEVPLATEISKINQGLQAIQEKLRDALDRVGL